VSSQRIAHKEINAIRLKARVGQWPLDPELFFDVFQSPSYFLERDAMFAPNRCKYVSFNQSPAFCLGRLAILVRAPAQQRR